jgi:hypothetical protein
MGLSEGALCVWEGFPQVIVDRRTVLTGSPRSGLFEPTLPVFDPTASAEVRLLLR